MTSEKAHRKIILSFMILAVLSRPYWCIYIYIYIYIYRKNIFIKNNVNNTHSNLNLSILFYARLSRLYLIKLRFLI